LPQRLTSVVSETDYAGGTLPIVTDALPIPGIEHDHHRQRN
jgi:hypothetical protein